MNSDNCDLACNLISKSYVAQGAQALSARHRKVKSLLSERKLPEDGWDDATIELFLQDLAMMDSNSFPDNVGVGEREGRVESQIIARRYFRLSHGIGRSGDIAAEQPKAAGSSLISKLATLLAADALKTAGLKDLGPVSILPLATGMALTMTLLAIKSQRPKEAEYVLWPRIDQKTCLKSIASANLTPIVIENVLEGNELRTDLDALDAKIQELGEDSIVCIATTTSCFAPRGIDRVVDVAKMCGKLGIPHLVNNAYGVQSTQICRELTSALRKGRVDAIVQSTDKNFMVPVGGSIICSPASNPGLVTTVNKTYPGRASVSAHLDLLITLLHWGKKGWQKVLADREEVFPYMQEAMGLLAQEVGEKLLVTPNNPISIGLTLGTLRKLGKKEWISSVSEDGDESSQDKGSQTSDVTFFGSMLWSRCISGTRVVARGKHQTVAGILFPNYGAHYDDYPHDYLTAAAALGTTKDDVDQFIVRVRKAFADWKKKMGSRRKLSDVQGWRF